MLQANFRRPADARTAHINYVEKNFIGKNLYSIIIYIDFTHAVTFFFTLFRALSAKRRYGQGIKATVGSSFTCLE